MMFFFARSSVRPSQQKFVRSSCAQMNLSLGNILLRRRAQNTPHTSFFLSRNLLSTLRKVTTVKGGERGHELTQNSYIGRMSQLPPIDKSKRDLHHGNQNELQAVGLQKIHDFFKSKATSIPFDSSSMEMPGTIGKSVDIRVGPNFDLYPLLDAALPLEKPEAEGNLISRFGRKRWISGSKNTTRLNCPRKRKGWWL